MEDNLLPAQNFKIYLQCVASSDSSFTDSLIYTLLFAIANQCPVNGGPAVYLAQSLLRQWNDTLYFSDEYACSAENLRVAEEDKATIYYYESKQVNLLATKSTLTLSPNPSNELVVIGLNGIDNENSFGSINIFNLLGELFLSQKIQLENGKSNLNVHTLPVGNYIVHLQTMDTIYQSKLSIQR
jgi:hypothetical protein